jgi:hypothetical protein
LDSSPELGNEPEVLFVPCYHVEAQMNCRSSDDPILKPDDDTVGGLFPLDASGELGYGEIDGMEDEIRAQIFHEHFFHEHCAPFTAAQPLSPGTCRGPAQ